jgi:hypothetical protein
LQALSSAYADAAFALMKASRSRWASLFPAKQNTQNIPFAILTRRRAGIEDARVRKLADGIIDSPQKEIEQMKALIQELQRTR